MMDPLQDLARRDGRFSVEAFRFLFASLDEAMRLAGKVDAEGLERHLTGQQLLAGMRLKGEQLFGPLCAKVWRRWGILDSLDWGRVVFLLVEAQQLSSREEDRLDDFREGFDFDAAFAASYEISIPGELDS